MIGSISAKRVLAMPRLVWRKTIARPTPKARVETVEKTPLEQFEKMAAYYADTIFRSVEI
ncbi:hypothetical protein BH11ARM1_BH11ARM1_07430 [soil metagenome]